MLFTYVFTYFLVTIISASVCFVILQQITLDMGTEQEVRAFRSYLIGIIWFMLSNTVWVWINYGYLHISGWPFSMANLIAICVASYYWFKYIEMRLNPKLVTTLKFKVISCAPLWIAVALIVTTPFTHLVFFYNENNEYIHGPFYSVMAVLAILYLVAGTIHIATRLSKLHAQSQRKQYVSLMYFLIFPVIGGIVDIIIPNLPIMELMLLFSTVLVYTNMQQSQIYNDTLTGLNNRRLADEYLQEQIELSSEEKPVIFFICDIDNFKQINDKYGHLEGDHALRLVAKCLKEETGHISCHVARWGGDEFVIILPWGSLDYPDEFFNKIPERLRVIEKEEELAYPLVISYGYSICNSPLMSKEVVTELADIKMYAQKKAHAETAL